MTLLATTVDQRLTTVDRWLASGPAVVNDGPPPLIVVDRWSTRLSVRGMIQKHKWHYGIGGYSNKRVRETPKVLLLAWEKFLEIKHGEKKHPPDDIQDLLHKLLEDVLEDIECKDSYDSSLDESTFLVTPLSDSNEDEFFTPSDDVELLLHHEPSISVVSILEGFTDKPPLEENDDLFDLESKENDWKKILYDAPIDDLITENKDSLRS
ncbi:hypothetical protein Tco_1183923 [Tanacetum coccineum]